MHERYEISARRPNILLTLLLQTGGGNNLFTANATNIAFTSILCYSTDSMGRVVILLQNITAWYMLSVKEHKRILPQIFKIVLYVSYSV